MNSSVLVMMGTYNGERFVGEQVNSIARQKAGLVDLLVSDDGSSDQTISIVERLTSVWKPGSFSLIEGPGEGFSSNFRHLILSSQGGYSAYAFSDQDDIWHDNKLAMALQWLDTVDKTVPAIFCGRTRIVDQHGKPRGHSPLFPAPPSFKNAIVQSIAGGNTMVFNSAAHALLQEAASRGGFVTHDWWAYQVVTGAGGVVHYEAKPTVDYRQHDGNMIGANSSWRARMLRLILMTGGRFAEWNGRNLDMLSACSDLLTAETLVTVKQFAAIRDCPSALQRLRLVKQSGIYRQSSLGQSSLYLACLLGKV